MFEDHKAQCKAESPCLFDLLSQSPGISNPHLMPVRACDSISRKVFIKQKSIPAQIRQLILYNSNDKG